MALKPNQPPEPAKSILVISSHVMTGAVGVRAAGFALERQGHPVWEVPTIILPWHPGHGPSTRQDMDPARFAQSLEDIANHPEAAKLGAVMTGYIGSAAQIAPIRSLIEKLKTQNPDLLYLCDPVIGEEKGLYVEEAIAQGIKDQLLPIADIITPNRFEFDWLTGQKSDNNDALVKGCEQISVPVTLITSAFALMRQSIANLLVIREDLENGHKGEAILCEHPSIPLPPSGTGDMFAALFLAQKLARLPDEQALKRASSAIFEVVARSSSQGYRDLEVARFGDRFVHPMAMVQLRRIATTPKSK